MRREKMDPILKKALVIATSMLVLDVLFLWLVYPPVFTVVANLPSLAAGGDGAGKLARALVKMFPDHILDWCRYVPYFDIRGLAGYAIMALLDICVLANALRTRPPANPVLDSQPESTGTNEHGNSMMLRTPKEIKRESDIIATRSDKIVSRAAAQERAIARAGAARGPAEKPPDAGTQGRKGTMDKLDGAAAAVGRRKRARSAGDTADPLHLGIYLGEMGKETFSYDTDEHALVLAPTRTGKTRKLLLEMISMLAVSRESMFAFDPKGELFGLCSGFLKRIGYTVNRIDFADPANGNWWNPLYRAIEYYGAIATGGRLECDESLFKQYDDKVRELSCVVGDPSGEQLAELLDIKAELDYYLTKCEREVDIFVESVHPRDHERENGSTRFYSDGTDEVLKLCIHYMLSSTSCPDAAKTPKTVSSIMTNYMKPIPLNPSNPNDKRSLVALYEEVRKLPIDHPASKYMQMLVGDSQYLSSFVNEAAGIIGDFAGVAINQMMQGTDHPIEELVEKPTVTFCIIPLNATDAMKRFAILYVNQLFTALQEVADANGNRLPRRMNMLCEELGQLPPLTDLDKKLSLTGGQGFRWILILQDFAQIESVYGRTAKQTIINNTKYKMLLETDDNETAEYFSEKFGTYTQRKTSQSSSKGTGSLLSDRVSDSEQLAERKRLSVDELLQWQVDYGEILWRRGHRPTVVPIPDVSDTPFAKMLGMAATGDRKADGAANQSRIAAARAEYVHDDAGYVPDWGPELNKKDTGSAFLTNDKRQLLRDRHIRKLQLAARQRAKDEEYMKKPKATGDAGAGATAKTAGPDAGKDATGYGRGGPGRKAKREAARAAAGGG